MSSLLDTLLARYHPALEEELRSVLSAAGPSYAGYYGMLHYHMGWLDAELRPTEDREGKRIRPLLCLLSCEAAGGTPEQALPAAASVETLHNFSLLHDDIEDMSDTRRGRPTVWRLWGQAQAINVGDGLFALAHLALMRLPDRGVPIERALAALRVFAQTCLALTHGQYLDMLFEDRLDVSVEEYLAMIENKTAVLIATSAYLGALIAGVDPSTAAHFQSFGFHLGLAFQVQDDVLGIWGDRGITGKSTSSDIETRKKTLPVVFGLERSSSLRQLYARGAIPPERVPWVAKLLGELGARAQAESVAADHHQKAIAALDQSGAAGGAGHALRELALNLLTRVS